MTILHDASGRIRPAVAASFVGLAIVAVAATSFTLGGRNASAAGPIVRPSASAPASAAPPPSSAPVATPVAPAPTAKPTPAPTAKPTPKPTPKPTHTNLPYDPAPIRVDLQTADDHDVSVDIIDISGILESASSGKPGDGASVDGKKLTVENIDADTLRVTWVDFPIDNADTLYIEWFDGRLSLLMVQPESDGESDAMAFDRELVLSFDEPVAAASVKTLLVEGLDTAR